MVLFVLTLVCVYLISYAITASNANNQLRGCYRTSLDRLSTLNSFQVIDSTDSAIGKIKGQLSKIKDDRATEALNLAASATISEALIDKQELPKFKAEAGRRDNLTPRDVLTVETNGYSCSTLYPKPALLPWG